MTALDVWLRRATRYLSHDSASQVRTEICEHFESAREAALQTGATESEAGRLALAALGDAGVANRQYRGVLLTRTEARLLRGSNWEARAICSHRPVKLALVALPIVALVTSIALFLSAHPAPATPLFVGGIALAIALGIPFLPIYTPARARTYRIAKWTAILSALALAFGANALQWSWLIACSVWPLLWIELKRISIRRKLPVARWPKQLYL